MFRWMLVCVIALAVVQLPVRSEPIAKELSAPIFIPPCPHPAAVLSIGSITKEYARHGYFRIGFLPEVIVDSVTLEIRNCSEIARIIETVKARTKPLIPDKGVSIQNVCIKGDYGDRRILVAAQLRDLGSSQWQFVDGVVSMDGNNFYTFTKAWLSVGGSVSGQLVAVSGLQTNLIHFLTSHSASYPAISVE